MPRPYPPPFKVIPDRPLTDKSWPKEKTDRDYHPPKPRDPRQPPREDPDAHPDPRVDPRARPRLDPRRDPFLENRLTVSPQALTRQQGAFHPRRPPPAGTKERKFVFAPHAASAVVRIFGGITEIGDFVDSLYFAIPKHLRPQGKQKLTAKMQAIYDHFWSMDFNKAVQNLVENEAKDRFYGKLGKLTAQANRDLNVGSVGFGRMQSRIRELQELIPS